MKFFDDAKLKMGVFLRERKERAEEKKAASRRRTAEHGAPLLWIWFLIAIAVSTLIGSTWMLIVFIAGSVGHVDWAFDWRAGNDGQPGRFDWFAEANIHAIYGGGLLLFCLGIAAFNAVWLHVRHYVHGLFRNVTTGIGIAIAIFMISGAIVTQQWGTDARTRDQVIAANTAQAGVAAVNAEIAAIETEMDRLCAPNLTTYQAQACRSGEAAWTERMATARQQRDYQVAGIERALADARQGDRWRARLLELRQQAAVASVQTVEAEAATVTATGFMATFARFLEEIRKPFIAVLGELLAMTMFGVALAAWRSRVPATDVERSGWADERHRIEDMREQEAVTPQPMKGPREAVFDAESGEELVPVRATWRKKPKRKGQTGQMEMTPESGLVEKNGAEDGGNRTASVTIGGLMEEPESAATDGLPEAVSGDEAAIVDHITDMVREDVSAPESSDSSAEEEAQQPEDNQNEPSEELPDLSDMSVEEAADEQTDQPEREPETDPSRLIAAE